MTCINIRKAAKKQKQLNPHIYIITDSNAYIFKLVIKLI